MWLEKKTTIQTFCQIALAAKRLCDAIVWKAQTN